MTGFDREAGALVPLHGCAGVVGRRALAAEFVQAPARFGTLVIEGLGELALLVERPPIAAVVNRVAEKCQRPTMLVEFGDLAEGQELCQHRCHDHRYRWATGYVHHGLVFDEVLHRDRAGGIRVGTRQAAESGAGTDRDDGRSALDRVHQHVDVADAGDRRVAGVAHWNRAVNQHKVVAVVLFHGGMPGGFRLFARGSLQRVVVVERDCVENQALDRWRCRTRQGLGAARCIPGMTAR